MPDELKEKWQPVLNPVFISSEEVVKRKLMVAFVKFLPRRDAKVNKFMKQMDEKLKKRQTTVLSIKPYLRYVEMFQQANY